jgi:hypothetical protein
VKGVRAWIASTSLWGICAVIMTKKWIVVAIGAAVLLGEQLPAKAQSSSTNGVAAKAFLEAVGCSQLPIGTCELLNADNAVNILATHRAALRQRYCGP